MLVPGAVDIVEIQGEEARPVVRRAAHPVEHRIHPLLRRHRLVELLPVRRAAAADRTARAIGVRRRAPGDVGAGPEHGGGTHAGFLGGDPDRPRAVPPEGIVAGERELLAWPRCVLHGVADHAGAIGAQAGGDRPEIGKGLGGKGRAHRRRRTFGLEPRQHRRGGGRDVVRSRAVDADQDHDPRSHLGRRHGHRRTVRERRRTGGQTRRDGGSSKQTHGRPNATAV